MGMKKIPKVDIPQQDKPAGGWQISGKTAFLLATDDLSTPQAYGFDHQDLRHRCGEPCGRLTLSPQIIPWKLVLKS